MVIPVSLSSYHLQSKVCHVQHHKARKATDQKRHQDVSIKSTSELPRVLLTWRQFQWGSNEVPVRFQYLVQAKSQLNNENLIFVASFQNKRMKSSWHITESCYKEARRQRTFVEFVCFVFFCAARTGKFCHLIKAWGMKTGLLRQHFLPWSVTKPHISPVWLSPQPAPGSIPPTEPSTPRKAASTGSAQNYFTRLFVYSCLQAPLELIG